MDAGEAHDCWTTTEAALTAALSEELREAWERLRETAAEFGEQRIYASHHSIMFSRRSCYFFVRPKQKFLELNVFLGRAVESPRIRKVVASSAAKRVHVIRVQHRDEVEAPITDWLREAYDFAGEAARPSRKPPAAGTSKKATATRPAAKRGRRKSR